MLEGKRTALVMVALDARFFIAGCVIYQGGACGHPPSGRKRSVRVVAVRATHEAFIHPVLERHVELRAHRGMTAIAEVRLRFGEQIFRDRRTVDGMTVRANDISLRMLGAAQIRPADGLGMALQAVIYSLRRFQQGERDDACLTAAFVDVRLPRAVAALAPRPLRRLRSRSDAAVMRILEEVETHVGMASLTDRATDIAIRIWSPQTHRSSCQENQRNPLAEQIGFH